MIKTINLSSFYYIKEGVSASDSYLGRDKKEAIKKAKKLNQKKIRRMFSAYNDTLEINFSKKYFSCYNKATGKTRANVNGMYIVY